MFMFIMWYIRVGRKNWDDTVPEMSVFGYLFGCGRPNLLIFRLYTFNQTDQSLTLPLYSLNFSSHPHVMQLLHLAFTFILSCPCLFLSHLHGCATTGHSAISGMTLASRLISLSHHSLQTSKVDAAQAMCPWTRWWPALNRKKKKFYAAVPHKA